MDELKCGCGGEVRVNVHRTRATGMVLYEAECQLCQIISDWVLTEAEAVAAFRLATRVDIVEQQAAEIERLQAEAQTMHCIVEEQQSIGTQQAAEWDRFWAAMGIDSEDISVDEAIAVFKEAEAEIDQLRSEIEQWERRGANYVEHVEHLDKIITDLRRDLHDTYARDRGEVWYWQGDGTNELESLTCPVQIRADDLRAVFSGIETLRNVVKYYADAGGVLARRTLTPDAGQGEQPTRGDVMKTDLYTDSIVIDGTHYRFGVDAIGDLHLQYHTTDGSTVAPADGDEIRRILIVVYHDRRTRTPDVARLVEVAKVIAGRQPLRGGGTIADALAEALKPFETVPEIIADTEGES